MAYLSNAGLTKLVELMNTTFATKDELAANNKNTSRTIEFIKTTNTAAGAALTGVTEDATLYDGKTIFLFLTYAAGTNATLNLTLAGGTTTGAKPLYYTGTSRMTTHYGAGSVISLTYVESVDGWRRADYINSNTYDRTLLNDVRVTAGSNGIFQYSLIMQNASGTWESLTTTSGTGTTKARNTHGFRYDKIWYYAYSNNIAKDALTSNDYIYSNTQVTFTYSSNCGTTLVANKPIYLVGTIGSDNLFYLDTTWWAQTEPTEEDGKIYIYLGQAYNTSAIYFVMDNPLFEYRNGKFQLYADANHTHASDAINALTGYSKPSSTSALAVSDTLNAALGKLEKALDGKQASGSYAAASHTHNYAGSASAGGPATSVAIAAASTNADRYVWFSDSSDSKKPVYDADFKYNPSTSNLTITSINGVAVGAAPKFTDTTYTNFVKSGSGAKAGLVPAPSTTAGTTKYLREDGTWTVPPDTDTKVGSGITLTGYTKPSSTSAVAATDTINAAIGKLEKALDSKQASGSYLTAHQTIKQNGVTGATRNCYGACTTAAATAAKAVSITAGTPTLEAGLKVTVKFNNANTASTPTLNVNSLGAKNIFHKGAKITSGDNKALLAGVCDFVYDGTQFHLVGNYIDIPAAMSATEATTGTATTARTISAKVLNDLIDAKIAAITDADEVSY